MSKLIKVAASIRSPAAFALTLLCAAACASHDDEGLSDGASSTTEPDAADQTTTPAPDDSTTTEPSDGIDTEPSTTDPDSATDSAGVTTSEVPNASCECADDEACNAPLCEIVGFTEEEGPSFEIMSEAALTCSLAALRDRKAGRIHWSYVGYGGQYSGYGTLNMYGDETVLFETGYKMDFCASSVPAISVKNLKAPEVFAACLADPDLGARLSCLREAFESSVATCQDVQEECEEGV